MYLDSPTQCTCRRSGTYRDTRLAGGAVVRLCGAAFGGGGRELWALEGEGTRWGAKKAEPQEPQGFRAGLRPLKGRGQKQDHLPAQTGALRQEVLEYLPRLARNRPRRLAT